MLYSILENWEVLWVKEKVEQGLRDLGVASREEDDAYFINSTGRLGFIK